MDYPADGELDATELSGQFRIVDIYGAWEGTAELAVAYRADWSTLLGFHERAIKAIIQGDAATELKLSYPFEDEFDTTKFISLLIEQRES